MRKFLLAAALSAGALCLNVGQASAGLFRCCCFKKNCCKFYCKPYNAFSPCCFGSVCFDGCCPVQQHAPCCPPPATCCADPCGGGCGAGPTFLPGLSPGGPTPPLTGAPPATGPGGQQFTPPAPQPLPNGAGAYTPARSIMPPIQPVGYYPYAYPYPGYPAAAPMGAVPMGGPSYWYQQ